MDKIRSFRIRGTDKNPRYYWIPNPAMVRAGHRSVRLSKDLATAMGEAIKLNIEYDTNKGNPKDRGLTLKDLFHQWQQSDHWQDLAVNTRKYYRTGVKSLGKDMNTNLKTITSAAVRKIYKALKDKPAKAAQAIRTAQAATAWGILEGLPGLPDIIELSPWNKQKITTRSSGGVLWKPGEIDAIVDAADKAGLASIGTAILIMEWLGANPTDIIRLTGNNYAGGIFTFDRGKTDTPIIAEASPRLIARMKLNKTQTTNTPAITLLVAEHTLRSWAADNFRARFRLVRKLAGLNHLKMGHLRHTAVTRMFDAGAEPMDIAAITGHKLKSIYTILDRYNRRTRAQADRATSKRMSADIRHLNQATRPNHSKGSLEGDSKK
ncbi:MAG: hypothetical protein L3J58_11765 [Emcibacter sp.]|nr:hypothetical protein [Emcibacter sp.]